MPWFFTCGKGNQNVVEPVVQQAAERTSVNATAGVRPETNQPNGASRNRPANIPPRTAHNQSAMAQRPRRNASPRPIPLMTVDGKTFLGMDNKSKIQWLLACAQHSQEENCVTDRITAGDMKMTGREATTYALEIASIHNRREVPNIATNLLENYPNPYFLFHGVNFSKSRVQGWARSGMISLSEEEVTPALQEVGKILYFDNSQNVHTAQIRSAQYDQLRRIKQRVVPANCISHELAQQEMHSFILASSTRSHVAVAGLNKVINLTAQVENFHNEVPRDCLTLLWNYIRQIPDEELKSCLKESLKTRFDELGSGYICALGTVQRIIDVPTGVDWSITANLSTEHLREELVTLAGTINESFEDEPDIAEHIRNVRQAHESGETTENPAVILTTLKRERFLATADIEFGTLRNLDRSIVQQQANIVFPVDTELA